MNAVWRNGKHKSKVEASQTIQLFHLDHLQETSSMRVLQNVHEALRQNDPSRAPESRITASPQESSSISKKTETKSYLFLS